MPEFTPFDYVIEKALISSDRLVEPYSISDMIVQINIYESIDKLYLTGDLTFIDTYDIFNSVDFLGAEFIDLEISIPSDDNKSFKRRFNIHSIGGAVKTNDNTEVIGLNLIEDSYFQSETKTISKSYTNVPNIILENIINDGELDRTLDYDGDIFQKDFRIIVPYLTPMEAMFFIKDRLTDTNGMPYYLYSSFGDEKRLKLTNLSEILNDSNILINNNSPFIYTQAAAAKTRALSLEKQSRIISKYRVSRSEELIKFIKNGSIGADYQFINLIKPSANTTYRFDINKQYNNIKNFGTIKPQDAPLYDEEFMDGLHNVASTHTSQIYSNGIYTDPLVNNIFDSSNHHNKSISKSMRQFITKSPMDFEIPGALLMSNGKGSNCVGRTIPVRFLKNIQPDGHKDMDDSIDIKKSGEYLIYSARHTFSSERYDVGVTGVKLTNLEGTTRPRGKPRVDIGV